MVFKFFSDPRGSTSFTSVSSITRPCQVPSDPDYVSSSHYTPPTCLSPLPLASVISPGLPASVTSLLISQSLKSQSDLSTPPISPRFKNHERFPVATRIISKSLTTMYKAQYDLGPANIADLISYPLTLAPCVPATRVYLLFMKCSADLLASGPLHLMSAIP